MKLKVLLDNGIDKLLVGQMRRKGINYQYEEWEKWHHYRVYGYFWQKYLTSTATLVNSFMFKGQSISILNECFQKIKG